jgi:opacity protein-like surface antigen
MLALSLLLALGLAAPAAAQDVSSFYVTPKLLLSFQNAELGGGREEGSVFGLGISVGTDLSYSSSLPLRLELEYIYRNDQNFTRAGNSHEVSAHSILGNAFFDILTDTNYTPYLGGGLGLALLEDRYNVLDASSKSNRWNFAWNLGGGVAWNWNENLALDLGYRYLDLGKTESVRVRDLVQNVELTAHEFSLGLRIMGF